MADFSNCISFILALPFALSSVVFWVGVFYLMSHTNNCFVFHCFNSKTGMVLSSLQILFSEKHHAVWLYSGNPLASEGAESGPHNTGIT